VIEKLKTIVEEKGIEIASLKNQLEVQHEDDSNKGSNECKKDSLIGGSSFEQIEE
jgi:hypothetical protein